MSPRWKKRRASGRKRVQRETLELAITTAVKNSDPQCEPFVGVLIEHHVPKSREDTNWAIKGIRFGRADRDKCSAALAIVVNKMQGDLEIQQVRSDDISPPVHADRFLLALIPLTVDLRRWWRYLRQSV
jgi:hypothetical protein